MYEQHISNEDIKKFVSAEGPLKGKEWDEFVEFSKEVNGHIRNCQDCLTKVREAQKVYDQAKEEIAEIEETLETTDGEYSSFDLADDIKDIENNSVRVAVMLHYADRLVGIPAVTDYIASKATDEEKKEILEVFKREGIHINPEIFPEKFKDTIMGKITKGAILNWGENDENKNWFKPTEEQADAMISEGGTKIGEKSFDYSSSEKATNGKTYGSEVAAIKGLVELISKSEGLSQEEQTELIEQMKTEVYTKSSLSSDLASRIKFAMEEKGIEASTIEVLGTIHDNWVKDNGNKFDAPDRAKRLYQFTDLRLMTYKDDGALADLLFLQPILEGAGIELDVQGKLKEEFEKQQKDYMTEHGITDSKGLRNYLKNLGETYPTIEGVTTTKGQKDDKENGIIVPRYVITEELQNSEILERMTQQVSEKIGLTYEKEQTVSDRSKHSTEVSDTAKRIAEEMGVPNEIGMQHDAGRLDTLEHDGFQRPNARRLSELDAGAKVKESELVPIKKKGFKEWIKGLVDKLMGKGEK